MKKFLFVLMWIQFGSSIINIVAGDLILKYIEYPEYIWGLGLYNDFILFWVLYIAWRITPESK